MNETPEATEKKTKKVKPEDTKPSLKETASKFRDYLNKQYQTNAAYVPQTDGRAEVTVDNWLEMPEVIANGLDMPGLPFGQITQVYGKKDSGKSSLLSQAIVAAQKQGILPILILTEHKFDYERLRDWMGGDPEELVVIPAEDLEMGFSYVEKILRDLRNGYIILEDEKGNDVKFPVEKCFIFWDSIGGTLSRSDLEGDVEDWAKDMGRFAQAVKKMVKRSSQLLHKVKDRCGILLLNQVWQQRSPTGIVTEQPFGGEAAQHYYALEIHLKKRRSIDIEIKKQEMGIGFEIVMDVKKNHISHSRLKTPMAAVAKGLIDVEEIDDFKKEFRAATKEK